MLAYLAYECCLSFSQFYDISIHLFGGEKEK